VVYVYIGESFAVLFKTIYDLAHGLGNNIADIFELITNIGSMAFTKKRRQFETSTLFRFEGYRDRERMPWMCDPVALRQLGSIEEQRFLQVPVGWVPIFTLSDGPPSKVHYYIAITVYITTHAHTHTHTHSHTRVIIYT
jgi:hypothetical protein